MRLWPKTHNGRLNSHDRHALPRAPEASRMRSSGGCVLAVGYLTTDLLITVRRFAETDEEVPILSFAEYPGGSAANTAVGLSRPGVRAGLVACIGRDDLGRRGCQALERGGLSTEGDVNSPNGSGSTQVAGMVDERA